MPLTKTKQPSQMYNWVDYTHTHIGGKCNHNCSYCYVQAMAKRFNGPRYQGPLHMIEEELNIDYGTGRTIFVEHCNDLFQWTMPRQWIKKVLQHCNQYPTNQYVFQTKNPLRVMNFNHLLPKHRVIGTTLETTFNDLLREINGNHAPDFDERVEGMINLRAHGIRRFVTIEPIIRMDVDAMLLALHRINPEFINIGADSKKTDLPEPTAAEVQLLISGIMTLGIEIRVKSNLERLLKGGKAAK